jgi:hypothetical protein
MFTYLFSDLRSKLAQAAKLVACMQQIPIAIWPRTSSILTSSWFYSAALGNFPDTGLSYAKAVCFHMLSNSLFYITKSELLKTSLNKLHILFTLFPVYWPVEQYKTIQHNSKFLESITLT